MKKVVLYTDGACSYNPGPGGWGCVLEYKGKTKELSGFNPNTTNNQMELTAIIEGLKAIKESCVVEIYSDSAYVVNAFLNDWITDWQLRGWKNAQKKPVKNPELWQELISLVQKHQVVWNKVKGHAGVELNERCDELATGEIEKNKPND